MIIDNTPYEIHTGYYPLLSKATNTVLLFTATHYLTIALAS